MASPVVEGTLGARPFTNQFVDVVHEDLRIIIDKNFEYAQFEITYFIESSADGIKIPLLFYASEFLDNFVVTVDGIAVNIQDIPDEIRIPENTIFDDFSYFFERRENADYSGVTIMEDERSGFEVTMRDLKYFETDMLKGTHTIEVSYRATKWIDGWNPVNIYKFRYALSPAKYWKSFGTLNIFLDASAFEFPITTNLGEPLKPMVNNTAEWTFNNLPTNVLEIYYNPEISDSAKALIKMGPFGIAICFGTVLFILQFIAIVFYRKKYLDKRFSVVVILGSILLPFLFLIVWMYGYVLISDAIGEHATGRGNYSFLVLVLYPFILIGYWLFNWGVDTFFKKFYKRKKS